MELSHALSVWACCCSKTCHYCHKLGVYSCKPLLSWNLLCPAPHPSPSDSPEGTFLIHPFYSSPSLPQEAGWGSMVWISAPPLGYLYDPCPVANLSGSQFPHLPKEMTTIPIPYGTCVRFIKQVLAQGLPHTRCSLSISRSFLLITYSLP